MAEPERTQVVVIGAGPAGLAVSACLKRHGVNFIVLERTREVGSAWRNHYRRLHLHTARVVSGLPYMRFPRSAGRYPSRQAVVDYLDQYARRFGIRPRFGQTVKRAAPHNGGWEIDTPARRYVADCVVVCTGYTDQPVTPSWPGMDDFEGQVLHSGEYVDGRPFRGNDVLVVGAGNSGAEIAVCLFEHGALPSISVRSPTLVVPRDPLGMPTPLTGILLRHAPVPLADAVTKLLIRLLIGDMSKYGLGRPSTGPFRQVVEKGRIPLIDVGTVALLKAGDLTAYPAIDRFTKTGVVFADGREQDFDAVVLATGYKARLDRFLQGAEQLTNERGYPHALGREAEVPGLYFVGFANPVSGALREIRLEAKRVARDIARKV